MSKKDFIALADAIREHNAAQRRFATFTPSMFNSEHLLVLAEFCASQNPRFMRDRWLDYIAGKCGKNGGKLKAA